MDLHDVFGHLIRAGRTSERTGTSILVSRVLCNPTAAESQGARCEKVRDCSGSC